MSSFYREKPYWLDAVDSNSYAITNPIARSPTVPKHVPQPRASWTTRRRPPSPAYWLRFNSEGRMQRLVMGKM
jgi:hypothetical protein